MFNLFLLLLFWGFLSSLLCYILGKLILSFFDFKGQFFFRLFVTNSIGILTLVFLFSMLSSSGKTINILLLPFFVYFIYIQKSSFTKPTIQWSLVFKEISWILGTFLLLYLYQSFFYFDFGTGGLKPLFGDYYCHSIMSDSLKLWGSENKITDLMYFFPENRTQLVPYHYAELWLTAFFSKLYLISSVNTLYLIVYSLLLSTLLLGICSLFEKSTLKTIFILGFSIVSLFITNIYSTQLPYLSTHSWPWDGTVMGIASQKQAFVSIFFLLGISLHLKNRKTEGFLIILAIPIFSIAFLPGVLSGIVLYTILEIVENRGRIHKTQIAIMLLSGLFLIVYFGFYKLYQSSYTSSYGSFAHILQTCKKQISVEVLMRQLINAIFFYVPFILLLLHSSLKLYRYWIFLAFCLCGGIFASMLTATMMDSGQFTSNINTFTIILVIISFSLFVCNGISTTRSKLILISIILIIVYNTGIIIAGKNRIVVETEDVGFLKSVAESIKKDVSVVLTFNAKVPKQFTGSFTVPFELYQYSNKTIIFSIGNPELYAQHSKMTYTDSNYYFNFTPLVVWKTKKKQNTLETFIEHYDLKYFYFKKGAKIPEYFMNKRYKKIISPKTNDFFICLIYPYQILKNKKNH